MFFIYYFESFEGLVDNDSLKSDVGIDETVDDCYFGSMEIRSQQFQIN